MPCSTRTRTPTTSSGLDELRLYNWRQRGPIPAYGSPKTIEALRKTFWYVFDDQPVESTKPAIETHTVDGPFTLLGRRIVPVPLYHGSMPILGFRIGRMAYLTDVSRIPDASYRMLEDLDVLVLNALRDRPHPTHLTIEQALAEAERIGARRTYLTHSATRSSMRRTRHGYRAVSICRTMV